MKITSRDKRIDEILTWSDIEVNGNSQSDVPVVKRITFTVEAGDIPTLEVETYNTGGSGVINDQGVVSPSTNIRTYCVDKVLIEAKGFDDIQRDKVQAHTRKEEDCIEKIKNERLSNINPISELEL